MLETAGGTKRDHQLRIFRRPPHCLKPAAYISTIHLHRSLFAHILAASVVGGCRWNAVAFNTAAATIYWDQPSQPFSAQVRLIVKMAPTSWQLEGWRPRFIDSMIYITIYKSSCWLLLSHWIWTPRNSIKSRCRTNFNQKGRLLR